MSTKVMYTVREDKQDMQKQLGCMNGIFQIFDRRYLLGQRRHANQKKLSQDKSDKGKEFNNASEQPKEKTSNKAAKEKHRVSVESSRNSYSSSCSSLDCSKRVQTEQSSFCPSTVSEPSSPTSHIKHDMSADIRDVVKDSMSRKPRVVPVKTVAREERKGPAMTHVDSPRPLNHQKPVPYDRKDQNLAKLQEISRGLKEGVKETSRFSYDGRESPYKLKAIANMKERPRLSLDSKQSSIKNRINVVDQSQSNEPGSNKRPSSSLVARLMGLEASNDFINEGDTIKIKPCLDEEKVSVSRISRKAEESKHASNELVSPRRGTGNPLTRIPLEPAPWKQEVSSKSVYGQIEKRLTEVEFKTSGKDLRALKQILEAIQRTKIRLEKTENLKNAQPVSPTIKGTPVKPVSDLMAVTNLPKVKTVNQADGKKYMAGSRSARNLAPIETKAAGRTKRPVSPSQSPTVSPRLQKAKNRNDKQSVNAIRKQSNGQLTVSSPKIRSINPRQTNDLSCRYSSHKRSLSQGDSVSLPSESDASVASQNEPEVTSIDWSQGNKNKFAERLNEYKSLAEHSMEQPSPVSVLDAFYTEDPPSPIQKKSYAYKDDKDLCFDEREWTQVGIDSLASSRELEQSTSGFNQVKLENIKHLVHQIELLNSSSDESTTDSHETINGDDIYIKEILLASGLLKSLDCATAIVHLHPTSTLINPELFNILEKTKECTSNSEKIRRKLIFDTVNYILLHKLARSASPGLWASKRKGKVLNEETLLEELCSEINNLQNNTSSGIYDEVIDIISDDVNKNSEDWDDNCSEVPALVLDIERQIFKDLVSEIVNAELAGQQDRPKRHRRQLFLM